MEWTSIVRGVVATVVFGSVGIVLFALAFVIMCRIAPFSVRKELAEDHNTALAVLMGSVLIGIALIVAAALHG
jgi:putative membrane protein